MAYCLALNQKSVLDWLISHYIGFDTVITIKRIQFTISSSFACLSIPLCILIVLFSIFLLHFLCGFVLFVCFFLSFTWIFFFCSWRVWLAEVPYSLHSVSDLWVLPAIELYKVTWSFYLTKPLFICLFIFFLFSMLPCILPFHLCERYSFYLFVSILIKLWL